jgi:hypothetical protein
MTIKDDMAWRAAMTLADCENMPRTVTQGMVNSQTIVRPRPCS